MNFERELIPLVKLRPNNENDRHGPLPSEHECIHWLLKHHRNYMINLAKDIAKYGLSPIDGILVLPAGEESPGDFIVWEGNRRIVALKLLDDPNRCHLIKDRKRFAAIRDKATAEIQEDIECFVAPSVEEAERLVELRHQGKQGGVGTVSWDGKQKTRHQQRLGKRGRYAFSQQVLDAIKDKLDDDLQKQIQDRRFPISTLDRVLKNTYAREFFGLLTEGGMPQRILEENETIKGLTRLLQDLSQGMSVKEFYTKDKIRDYLDKYDKKSTPNKKKAVAEPVPLSEHESETSLPAEAQRRSRPLSYMRKKLIPSEAKYSIKDPRVNTIYSELRKLNVDTNRNAVAVLFRVFLELSTELYLDAHGIPYNFYSDKLSRKLGMAVNDMNKNQWLDKRSSKGINSAISSTHDPHTVDTFHAYVHNRQYNPEPSGLNTAWDNLQPFFDALFGHLE